MDVKIPVDMKIASVREGKAFRLVPVFASFRKAINLTGIAAWMASLFFFWWWWLSPEHIFTPMRYAIVTGVLAWITLIPAYFVFIFAGARVPAQDCATPTGSRLAIVVTKTPSEPLDLVKTTLSGALNQAGVKHDTWLADEDPDQQTLDWCGQHGIRVATRKGLPDYQRQDWPHRARSKEGNLSYFYERYGYAAYDIVSQFDADHVPSPDYLRNAAAPFADPAVGYVSAPSICDSNAAQSWSARGRLYIEASLHGALQAGYNARWAPLCIGSHYTVRTDALKQIGGLGPELAEDHSTTLMFNAGGWRGIHAVDAIAHGAGPDNFADLVTQEFQWSRSLVTILLKYSPIYVPKLNGRVRFQFLFSELWYPLFSTVMAVMYLMPIYALLSGAHLVNVTYIDFVIHMAPLSLVLLGLAYWWRSTGLFRPADAKILSWEGTAFLFLRWPWSLMGSIAALVDYVRGEVASFKITPKGKGLVGRLPLRAVAPYLLLATGATATALFVEEPGTAAGFYFFNLLNAAIYATLSVVIVVRHAVENNLPVFAWHLSSIATASVIASIGYGVVAAGYENGAKGLNAMMIGIQAFRLTETVYPPAGAGLGEPGKPVIRFKPAWGPRRQDTSGASEQ